jgi:cytochrome P450
MEAHAVFTQVLRRWPGLRLMDQTPRWNGNPVYRGLESLRVIEP